MKIKICECYKSQLKDVLKNVNDTIDLNLIIPKCKHKKELFDNLKNVLIQYLVKNGGINLNIFGGKND
jgi:hypothetical protein